MLDFLQNAFSWIIETASTVFSFFEGVVSGLFNIIKSIPMVITMFTSSIGYLPSTIAAFAAITVTISVVYLIVGRDTGG